MTKSMTIFLRNLKRSKYDFVMHITISLKSATQRAPRGNFFLQKRKKIVATLSSKLDLIEKSIFDHYYLPPLFTRIFGRLWQAFHTTRWKLAAWNMVVRKWNMACPKAAEAEAVCLAAFFSSLHLLGGSSSSLWQRPPVVRSITIW